ncbi:MAG: glycerate kinase, partial [Fidelibacterota bacterium]
INALRKHCSRLKGGRLVQAGRKAAWVTLAISDVPGDSPESIGSGPTVGDSSTLTDCWNILKKYDLEESLPERILQHLNQESSETPKPDDTLFSSSRYEIVAMNGDAVRAARQRAEELAFSVEPDQRFVIEDVAEAAGLWSELKRHSDSALKKPYIIICGGEPTVKVKGSGKGGRNMELALRLAASPTGKFTFLSAGTDGTDGPTDAAGAFADETTLSRAEGVGLDLNDYLDRNDSYGFFQKMGDLFVTGPTGTNVMDLEMLVVWE